MDSGSQVTLVRAELLPLLEQHNGWAPSKWKERDCDMEAQPVGASGQELGAESIVAVHTVVEQTRQGIVIPCFVLKSSKPIWQSMVHDCAMVLGTNAMDYRQYMLMALQFPLNPVESTKSTSEYAVRRVLLSERAWLAPGKSQWVKVKVEQSSIQESSPDEVGVITPVESTLAGQACDFVVLMAWRSKC